MVQNSIFVPVKQLIKSFGHGTAVNKCRGYGSTWLRHKLHFPHISLYSSTRIIPEPTGFTPGTIVRIKDLYKYSYTRAVVYRQSAVGLQIIHYNIT